jgi:glyoxylase-like metal-dependent hydrolase (beta-lactamase superfamily II)
MSEEIGQSKLERLSNLVHHLRAPNPGPMTLTGTNSYIVGSGGNGSEVTVIDPGPDTLSHLEAIVAAAESLDAKITTILVTHGHPDHFPGAAKLKEMTGATVGAYYTSTFPHDLDLRDGMQLRTLDTTIKAIFTPGHAFDHLCYYLEEEDALFTGDLILGQGTVIVAPPKGDMKQYLHSLHKLEQDWSLTEVIYGGHGPAITSPLAKIREYIKHRQGRQDQLVAAMQAGATTVPEIVERIYQDVDKRMWPAAARQVMAYMIMLEEQGQLQVIEERPATEPEAKLLNPEGVVDPVAAAELGIEPGKEKVKRYRLISR